MMDFWAFGDFFYKKKMVGFFGFWAAVKKFGNGGEIIMKKVGFK